VDRPELADFLRRRREALAPSDVGLPAGSRRRTAGLRREEIAHLTGMSVDYYARLEQARGPQPSTQMLSALSRTLRLTADERDHLYRLAGHAAPERTGTSTHVRPALLHVLDQLHDCAAFVISDLNVALAQNRLSILLQGDYSGYTGLEASMTWRWFAHPELREKFPRMDHEHQSRILVADLRATWSRRRGAADVEAIVNGLLATSPEFASLWAEHEVGLRHAQHKTMLHPQVGEITVDCETLLTPDEGQSLIILSAIPGTEAYDKLKLIAVLGEQELSTT
jgi:transcriptional regulator with XRE-family HTH domain